MCRSCGGNEQRLQPRMTAYTMFSCHSIAPWRHDTLCPLHLDARAICRSWVTAASTMFSCDILCLLCLHAICTLLLCCNQSLSKCGLKLQCINRATVVVAHIPGFTAYVIDGGQGWTAAFVSFDHLKRSAGKM